MSLFNNIDTNKATTLLNGSPLNKPKKTGMNIPIAPGAVWEPSVPRFTKGRKYQTLTEVIGEVKPNETLWGVTAGAWSHHDLLYYIISKYGPVHLCAATWTIGNKVVEKLMQLVREKQILSSHFLFDRQIKMQKQKAYHLINAQKELNVGLANLHAKVTVIFNDQIELTYMGSQNWTSNPRVEVFVLSTIPAVAEFNKKWIMELHSKSDKFDVNI